MVDNFPFANTRREAAIFYIPDYHGSRSSLSLFHGESTGDELPSRSKRANEKRNEMVRERFSSVVVFQIFFCFFLFQGTAGDSSSQTDTNTVVGKPKLGKKGNKIY